MEQTTKSKMGRDTSQQSDDSHDTNINMNKDQGNGEDSANGIEDQLVNNDKFKGNLVTLLCLGMEQYLTELVGSQTDEIELLKLYLDANAQTRSELLAKTKRLFSKTLSGKSGEENVPKRRMLNGQHRLGQRFQEPASQKAIVLLDGKKAYPHEHTGEYAFGRSSNKTAIKGEKRKFNCLGALECPECDFAIKPYRDRPARRNWKNRRELLQLKKPTTEKEIREYVKKRNICPQCITPQNVVKQPKKLSILKHVPCYFYCYAFGANDLAGNADITIGTTTTHTHRPLGIDKAPSMLNNNNTKGAASEDMMPGFMSTPTI